MDSGTPNQEIANNPLRDPRLFSMQALQHTPLPLSPSQGTSATLVSNPSHDPSLEAKLQPTDPSLVSPSVDRSPTNQTFLPGSDTEKKGLIQAPLVKAAVSEQTEQPSKDAAKPTAVEDKVGSNLALGTSIDQGAASEHVDDGGTAHDSNQIVMTSDSAQSSSTTTARDLDDSLKQPNLTPGTLSQEVDLQPEAHQPRSQQDSSTPVPLSGGDLPLNSTLSHADHSQSLLEHSGNHLGAYLNPAPESVPNGEQEMIRSREMSLSIGSNGDGPAEARNDQGLTHHDAQLPAITGPFQDTNQSSQVAAQPDSNPSNPDSLPQTASSLKFPLPLRPSNEHGSTALFAPSPPTSVTNENHRSPPRQPVLSRLASLKQRVEKDSMDGEAWVELIADAEKKGDLEKTREVYQSFLQNFPDAANQWIAYADLELGHGHFPEVEQIFSRCLRSSVSVDLWAFYLNYIRRVNLIEGDKAAASRAVIISAYDFSLNHIGIDHQSGQIWMDYINIVNSGEATGTWQEQQKMDSLRKLYQRAVCIPLDNIEQIWKDYDQFEHQMSKMTAKKFLAEKSAQYMMARSALKEMKSLTSSLLRPKVPVKPNWKRVDVHKQLKQWKDYLRWEESNPLELQDRAMLNARIQYAYRQAVMHMRFYPEIWYMAASHLERIEKSDEALALLQAGFFANPTSLVITYALVEAHEKLNNYDACNTAFSSLIGYYHSEIEEINKTIEKEIQHGIPVIESKNASGSGDTVEVGHELTDEEKQRPKQEEQLRANITALYKPKIDELREAAGSIWITEMRFARRTQGIKPARAVFTRARKSTFLTRHVFEASAMMEYHWNKEPAVATKVFDLGLKSFSEDVDYVYQYLNFLINLNDDSNARALFEKTVSKIPPEAAKPLWRRWAAYELIYGDTSACQKLDARMAEHFPDWGVVERLSERHNYVGLQDVLGRELGTSVEPIPLRRSPSPVPAHLEGFGFKRTTHHDPPHSGPIPSGPSQPRARPRDRSFSPEFRGKRARAPRHSISPDRRNGGSVIEHVPPPNKRGRDGHEGAKRNRFGSPSRGRDLTPPSAPARENPYAWFPERVKYFLSILPTAASFDGPRLDTHTILQVLTDANIPTSGANNNVHHNGNGNHGTPARESFHNALPPGWGPNRGGRSNSNRRGRRK